MRLHNDKWSFSPTDLANFLRCEHRITLDRKLQRREIPKPQTRGSAHTDLHVRHGSEHEKSYVQKLKDKGRNVVEIPDRNQISFSEARDQTLAAMKSGADVIDSGAPHRRLLARLRRFPLPDPFQDLVYLFGVGVRAASPLAGRPPADPDHPTFLPLWAHTEEKAAFEQTIALIHESLEHHPDAHVYHYGAADVVALKKLIGKYGTCEQELDDLLRAEVFVDLLGVVRQSIRISHPPLSSARREARMVGTLHSDDADRRRAWKEDDPDINLVAGTPWCFSADRAGQWLIVETGSASVSAQPVTKSKAVEFRFPPQQHKLSPGDSVRDPEHLDDDGNALSAGSVHELGEDPPSANSSPPSSTTADSSPPKSALRMF